MARALIISEGGAGLPVVEKNKEDPSPRSTVYVDSAFLNVLTSLLLGAHLRRLGHDVTIRFGVQYFTSANQYHIPESFERKYENEDLKINRERLEKIFEEIPLVDNEDILRKLEVMINIFEKYLEVSQTRYIVNANVHSIRAAYNYMGKIQVLEDNSPIRFAGLNMKLGDANQNTIELIEYIRNRLGLEDINIIYDQGPRLKVDREMLLELIPENLKQARSNIIAKFSHILGLFHSINYQPSLDFFPLTIPDRAGQYNGIRYMLEDKNRTKLTRTYIGLGGAYSKEIVDIKEVLNNSKEDIYMTFPFAVFEGEMIKPADISDLIDPVRFRRWLIENEEEAKRYERIIIIEGIEGVNSNPHTIGLREKIIAKVSGDKYLRLYNPATIENGSLKRLDEFEIENEDYKTQLDKIITYLSNLLRLWIEKVI